MLGFRFSRLVHAAIASGALVLAACPSGGGKGETESDTDPTESTSDDTTTAPPIDPTGGLPPSPTDPLPPAPPDPPPPDPPPVDPPPALLGVKLLDPSTLQLSFTEPLAPVDMVNPKRFRLSVAQGYAGNYGGQPNTTLVDPRFYNLDTYCSPNPPPPCYYEPPYNYYCYYGPNCYYQSTGPLQAIAVAPLDGDPTSIVISLAEAVRPTLCQFIDGFGEDDNFRVVLHLHYAAGGFAELTDLSGQALPALGDAWVKYDGEFYAYEGPVFASLNPFLPIPCDLFD